mmetsp:Transcript_4786/g.14966  ORF Transcript_4786/g.14966 Transcript_4786/m.14966 type:complete len:81 (+) Transcript_4786:153-395(+)
MEDDDLMAKVMRVTDEVNSDRDATTACKDVPKRKEIVELWMALSMTPEWVGAVETELAAAERRLLNAHMAGRLRTTIRTV